MNDRVRESLSHVADKIGRLAVAVLAGEMHNAASEALLARVHLFYAVIETDD